MEEYTAALFDRLFLLAIGFALGGIFHMYMYSRHIGRPWKIKPPISKINPQETTAHQNHTEDVVYYYCLDCQVIKKREL